MHVQNILETSEPRPKQNRRPEPQKHTRDLVVLNFEKLLITPKCPSFIFSAILQQNGC